jgi:acyl-CoA thioesterase-1
MACRPVHYAALIVAVHMAAACSQGGEKQQAQANKVEAQSAETAAAPANGDERLVLAFGDSLYAGRGVEADESFPSRLEASLRSAGVPARVQNAGVSGDTTAAGRERLAFTLDGLPRPPDLAIVGLGGNDMLRGIDPGEARANLDAILAELKRRHIKVVLTGMLAAPNLGRAYADRFNAIFPELARKYDAPLYPFFLQDVVTRPDLMQDDHIHPNAAGVRLVVERMTPMVAKALRKTSPASGPPPS